MKIKHKKTQRASLSDKIADALTVKPRADIEDDHVFGTKPKTVSRADLSSESEDETAISEFRKRSVNLLSDLCKKYEGEVVSSKKSNSGAESDSDDSLQNNGNNEDLSDESESSITKIEKKLNATSDSKGLESESDESEVHNFSRVQHQDTDDDDDDGSMSENDDEGYDISQMKEPINEQFEHMKKQNVSEEVKKGECVRNQLLIWESLLEMRIHLQRCMNTANQLPMPEVHKEMLQNHEFSEQCTISKANITNVIDKILNLQNILLKNFPETKNLCSNKQQSQPETKKKEDSDEEIPSDTDNEEIPSDTEPEQDAEQSKPAKDQKAALKPTKKRKLEDYEKVISASHKAFKSFRDSTIQKWNEKTRLASAISVKTAPTNTILQQISYILSDKQKLVRRTQLKRTEYDIIGYKHQTIDNDVQHSNGTEINPVTRDKKDGDEYIPEIFDDSDFYHQLLRELIECKSADITDPVQLSRQWIALQQMRSKMKRKVDTKATKGRKIKYVVHNQLVNYMGPEKTNTWNEENTNELYNSLFGKMFEQNNVGVDVNLDNGLKVKK